MKLSDRIRKAWNTGENKDLPAWWNEAELLEARVAELEGAIRKYADHQDGCHAITCRDGITTCDCGFSQIEATLKH